MGILNCTPDSFSDGGSYFQLDKALKKASDLIEEGADILDIGGESSRPGALPISVEEELSRVIPLIKSIRSQSNICISIDTTKPEVMKEAVKAGAGLINDINALRAKGALQTAAELQVPVCLMHMLGTPKIMQESPSYPVGIIEEINSFFSDRIAACLKAQISTELIILDPGFGFGKTLDHNLTLIRRLEGFKKHKRPIALGVSRKHTLGVILNKPENERLMGSIVMTIIARQNGLGIIRTHDVEQTKQALLVEKAINKEALNG
jgi:dihydropteroate synthase